MGEALHLAEHAKLARAAGGGTEGAVLRTLAEAAGAPANVLHDAHVVFDVKYRYA